MYGVGRFYRGLDLISPLDDMQQILQLNSLNLNQDVKFALNYARKIKKRDLSDFTAAVLNNEKFQTFLKLSFAFKDSENPAFARLPSSLPERSSSMIQLDHKAAEAQL